MSAYIAEVAVATSSSHATSSCAASACKTYTRPDGELLHKISKAVHREGRGCSTLAYSRLLMYAAFGLTEAVAFCSPLPAPVAVSTFNKLAIASVSCGIANIKIHIATLLCAALEV